MATRARGRPAGHFERHAAVDLGDRARLVQLELVEHDPIDAGGECLAVREILHLDFDHDRRVQRACALHRRR